MQPADARDHPVRVAQLGTYDLGRGVENVPADDVLEVLCTRRLGHTSFPVVEIEAEYVKCPDEGGVRYETLVMVGGYDDDGDYEALTLDVGDSEQPAFWARVLVTLKARGLTGVQTVVADEHGGLEDALAVTFPGARWQRDPVSAGPVDTSNEAGPSP